MSEPQTLIDAARALARYNRLANARLYDACDRIGDSERRRARPAFFRSIHGTLNHILVGDRIWMARFQGKTVPSSGLDAILYEKFDDLRAARVEQDALIQAFAQSLTDARLLSTIAYRNNAGLDFEDPVWMLILHFFNHQTHHRGQVHDMLCQTSVAPPSLDLHRVLKPMPDSRLSD